jgi:pectate lyase
MTKLKKKTSIKGIRKNKKLKEWGLKLKTKQNDKL